MSKLISFKLLAAVTILSDEGDYVLAAQRISTTASQLENEIATLEQELGCKLLRQIDDSIELTAEGHVFVAAARTALTEIKRIRDRQGS